MKSAVPPKAYDVMAPTCPSRRILNRIGARWTIFVIVALAESPMRFNELKSHIRGITSKTLTETLRALEYDGLIARTELAGTPTPVLYSLTGLGESLQVPLAAVRRWAEAHTDDILEANSVAGSTRSADTT